MKSSTFILLSVVGASALTLAGRAEPHVSLSLQLGAPSPVIVREAPPRPVIVERQYNSPGPGFVWVPGHNSWVRGGWVWIPGTWVRPPQPNTFYVEGRWDERSRNWIEPHWEVMAPPPPPAPMPPQVVIVDAPPPPRHEHRPHAPGPDFVWIDGYWGWHGHRHEWVEGRWERPPHGHREWIAPRWEHRGGSYVFIEGSWR